jgi:hypothetical protein
VAEKIPSWPKVTIHLYDDHNAEVKIAGRSHPVNHHDPRQAAIAIVSDRAGQLGRPVKATAVESDGASWPLIIHPDGRVEAIEPEGGRKGGRGGRSMLPIILAAVVAFVLVAGTGVYLVVTGSGGTPKPTAAPKLPQLPAPSVGPDQFVARPVPPGWSTNASWTVDLAPNTTPVVSPDGSEVAVLTPDNKLAVFDGTGKVIYQDTLPSQFPVPTYTMIDDKPVLAAATDDTLYYWPGDGALPKAIKLPNSADVQYFGTSPLIEMSDEAGAGVISGGKIKAVPNQKRDATILLAEGDRALMARYAGPLYWSQPDHDLQELDPTPPKGSKGIDRVVAASPGLALVLWKTADPEKVIPAVHSSANGSVVATCQATDPNKAAGWQWVPDIGRKVAAWGECLINFGKHTTSIYTSFTPQSITGTTIYGTVSGTPVATTPGGKSYPLAPNTARPWGIVGGHAMVVHNSVLYALDKK